MSHVGIARAQHFNSRVMSYTYMWIVRYSMMYIYHVYIYLNQSRVVAPTKRTYTKYFYGVLSQLKL